MDTIWRGPLFVVPFLRLGTTRNILFPETGTAVPFVIENYAYLDGQGRETLTFIRTFDFGRGRRRRFDATMIYSEQREAVVDYLGTHQHVAADLDLFVDDGALVIRTGAQRFLEGRARFGLPTALTGQAEVRESYDERQKCFRIDVRVVSGWAGPIFGYSGTFTARYLDTRAARVPAAVKPYREQSHD